jgi:predicted ribosome-associated RNA-binding protein Tma20
MISLPLSEKIKEFTTVLDMNFYDLDKDGDLDIILSRTRDYNMHYIQILKNTNNIFEDVTDDFISNSFYFDGGAVERLYIGDFDNDGIVDMRTNINHGDVVIWELINNKFSIK